VLGTTLEPHRRESARHLGRNEIAEPVLARPFVQESLPNEGDQGSRCVTTGSDGGNFVEPSGAGKRNPWELSNGSPDGAANLPFHMSFG
jgi:hypothetical protein